MTKIALTIGVANQIALSIFMQNSASSSSCKKSLRIH